MRTIRSVKQMQRLAAALRRKGCRIGFVPTMGFLHAGHLSLVRRARKSSDVVIVSIFVNPIQFGPGEDFERYPRNLRRDSALCRSEGVDILFCPRAAGLYAGDHSVFVDEHQLSAGLCGASRPGHFRGVATVVAKLFNIVQPDVAVFGQKDFQQARIVEQMVRDLSFPVRIVVAPTFREPDGLALSSRNVYLAPEERREAVNLSRSLRKARELYRLGERSRAVVERAVRRLLEASGVIRIEYVEFVDRRTLARVDRLTDGTILLLAARLGRTRLIDNMALGRPRSKPTRPV